MQLIRLPARDAVDAELENIVDVGVSDTAAAGVWDDGGMGVRAGDELHGIGEHVHEDGSSSSGDSDGSSSGSDDDGAARGDSPSKRRDADGPLFKPLHVGAEAEDAPPVRC